VEVDGAVPFASTSAKHVISEDNISPTGDADLFSMLPSAPFRGDSPVRGRIKLQYFISHGRLWDAYHAEYHNLDSDITHQVIAKIASTETYGDTDEHAGLEYCSPEEARNALLNEAELYSGPLSEVRPRIVPGFLGLFLGDYQKSSESTQYWLMLMEDGGRDIESFQFLSDTDRECVFRMYEQLHKKQIAHIDVHARHVLRDATGRLSLIDFEGAETNADGEILRREMDEVRHLLYTTER